VNTIWPINETKKENPQKIFTTYKNTHPKFIDLYNKYFYLFEVKTYDYAYVVEPYEIKLDDDVETAMFKREKILEMAKENLDVVERDFDRKRDMKFNEFKKEFDLMLYKNNYTYK